MTFEESIEESLQDQIASVKDECSEFNTELLLPSQKATDTFYSIVRSIAYLFPHGAREKCGAVFITDHGELSLVFQPFERRLTFNISYDGSEIRVLKIDENNKLLKELYVKNDPCVSLLVRWVLMEEGLCTFCGGVGCYAATDAKTIVVCYACAGTGKAVD